MRDFRYEKVYRGGVGVGASLVAQLLHEVFLVSKRSSIEALSLFEKMTVLMPENVRRKVENVLERDVELDEDIMAYYQFLLEDGVIDEYTYNHQLGEAVADAKLKKALQVAGEWLHEVLFSAKEYLAEG